MPTSPSGTSSNVANDVAPDSKEQRSHLGVPLLVSLLVHIVLLSSIGVWLVSGPGKVQVMVVELQKPVQLAHPKAEPKRVVKSKPTPAVIPPVKNEPFVVPQEEEPSIVQEPVAEEPLEVLEETAPESAVEMGFDGEASEQLRQNYLQEIMRLVDAHKRYPLMARKLGQEGTVQVLFTLHPSGLLTDCKVEVSSGVRALDRAAYQAVVDVARFPAVPEQLGLTPQFLVAIDFVLN